MTAAIPSPKSPPEQGPVWHTLSIDDVQREERVDIATGLSQAQAEERLKKYGPNAFAAEKKEPGWRAFLRQYQDPMQIVLLVAGVVSAIIQEWGTALLLVALTVFNAVMGLNQEGKAEASVAALQKMMIVKSRVRSASGLLNLFAPTSVIIMGALAVARVGYDRWMRFVWPILLIVAVVSILLVAIGALVRGG